MSPLHIIGGALALGLGVFGIYDEYFVVVEFLKGALQPILWLAGLLIIMSGLLSGKTKPVVIAIGLLLLGVGIYGFFDEYYATLDFFKGAVPIGLLLIGSVAVVSGVRHLK